MGVTGNHSHFIGLSSHSIDMKSMESFSYFRYKIEPME